MFTQDLDSSSTGLGATARSDGFDLGVDELKVLLRLTTEIGDLDDDGTFSRLLHRK